MDSSQDNTSISWSTSEEDLLNAHKLHPPFKFPTIQPPPIKKIRKSIIARMCDTPEKEKVQSPKSKPLKCIASTPYPRQCHSTTPHNCNQSIQLSPIQNEPVLESIFTQKITQNITHVQCCTRNHSQQTSPQDNNPPSETTIQKTKARPNTTVNRKNGKVDAPSLPKVIATKNRLKKKTRTSRQVQLAIRRKSKYVPGSRSGCESDDEGTPERSGRPPPPTKAKLSPRKSIRANPTIDEEKVDEDLSSLTELRNLPAKKTLPLSDFSSASSLGSYVHDDNKARFCSNQSNATCNAEFRKLAPIAKTIDRIQILSNVKVCSARPNSSTSVTSQRRSGKRILLDDEYINETYLKNISDKIEEEESLRPQEVTRRTVQLPVAQRESLCGTDLDETVMSSINKGKQERSSRRKVVNELEESQERKGLRSNTKKHETNNNVKELSNQTIETTITQSKKSTQTEANKPSNLFKVPKPVKGKIGPAKSYNKISVVDNDDTSLDYDELESCQTEENVPSHNEANYISSNPEIAENNQTSITPNRTDITANCVVILTRSATKLNVSPTKLDKVNSSSAQSDEKHAKRDESPAKSGRRDTSLTTRRDITRRTSRNSDVSPIKSGKRDDSPVKSRERPTKAGRRDDSPVKSRERHVSPKKDGKRDDSPTKTGNKDVSPTKNRKRDVSRTKSTQSVLQTNINSDTDETYHKPVRQKKNQTSKVVIAVRKSTVNNTTHYGTRQNSGRPQRNRETELSYVVSSKIVSPSYVKQLKKFGKRQSHNLTVLSSTMSKDYYEIKGNVREAKKINRAEMTKKVPNENNNKPPIKKLIRGEVIVHRSENDETDEIPARNLPNDRNQKNINTMSQQKRLNDEEIRLFNENSSYEMNSEESEDNRRTGTNSNKQPEHLHMKSMIEEARLLKERASLNISIHADNGEHFDEDLRPEPVNLPIKINVGRPVKKAVLTGRRRGRPPKITVRKDLESDEDSQIKKIVEKPQLLTAKKTAVGNDLQSQSVAPPMKRKAGRPRKTKQIINVKESRKQPETEKDLQCNEAEPLAPIKKRKGRPPKTKQILNERELEEPQETPTSQPSVDSGLETEGEPQKPPDKMRKSIEEAPPKVDNINVVVERKQKKTTTVIQSKRRGRPRKVKNNQPEDLQLESASDENEPRCYKKNYNTKPRTPINSTNNQPEGKKRQVISESCDDELSTEDERIRNVNKKRKENDMTINNVSDNVKENLVLREVDNAPGVRIGYHQISKQMKKTFGEPGIIEVDPLSKFNTNSNNFVIRLFIFSGEGRIEFNGNMSNTLGKEIWIPRWTFFSIMNSCDTTLLRIQITRSRNNT